jgi:HPr Serine kinase C-terminal domain
VPTVFGLDVQAERPLPFLETAAAKPTGRKLEISLPDDAGRLSWPPSAELISDQRQPGGGVNFQIEADPREGFRIWGPEYGTCILSADGQRLRGAYGSGGPDAWQRLLIAQALPFAAVLQGLEVLHASAVVVQRQAVALTGHSGSGKTSLALELCRRGAGLLADDVVALERLGDRLVVHPGTPVAGVDLAEADRLLRAGGGEGSDVLAVNARERIARVWLSPDPAPLQKLLFIDRRPGGPASPSFEAAADARALLASTFNLLLTGPQRLERLLDACALIAGSEVERIVCGTEVGVEELGAAVEQRIGGLA